MEQDSLEGLPPHHVGSWLSGRKQSLKNWLFSAEFQECISILVLCAPNRVSAGFTAWDVFDHGLRSSKARGSCSWLQGVLKLVFFL